MVQTSKSKLQEVEKSTGPRAIGKRGSLYHSHVPSEVTDLYIESINDQNLTWKANECMLTKTHKRYNKTLCEKKMSLTQVAKP